MPDVENTAVTVNNPSAWIGINVPVAMPGMFCALGRVEIAGLWHIDRGVNPHWKRNPPPVARGWKTLDPGHKGGF